MSRHKDRLVGIVIMKGQNIMFIVLRARRNEKELKVKRTTEEQKGQIDLISVLFFQVSQLEITRS